MIIMSLVRTVELKRYSYCMQQNSVNNQQEDFCQRQWRKVVAEVAINSDKGSRTDEFELVVVLLRVEDDEDC